MYILGTDEAGYGPNLGPLVISVSAWNAKQNVSGAEMYSALYPVVLQASHKKELRNCPGSFLLDDSKKLYHGRRQDGLKYLEFALLTALKSLNKINSNATIADVYKALCEKSIKAQFDSNQNSLERNASNQKNAWQGSLFDSDVSCTPSERSGCDIPPWEIPSTASVPLDANKEQLEETVRAFERIQNDSQIRLADLRSDAVFPWRFNQQCTYWGNKSTLLSKTTLNLLESVLINCSDESEIWCDKHGGRDFYAPLLEEQFHSDIEIIEESRGISSYCFQWNGFPRRIHFQAKGDCAPAGALASIACKYLRELFMNQLNDFWSARVPGLEPTAGYPVDAKRFLEQIQPALNFPLNVLWRNR